MKKYISFLLIFISVPVFSQLRINELMTNNVSAVMDDAWDYSMWVEIYNASETSLNPEDYFFTDDPSDPEKWQPSSRLIPPGGFHVLWFERPEITGRASFKLAPEGGTLYLFDKNGKLADSVTYPQQKRNTSYGRATDGNGNWVFFPDYSPGESNNGKTQATAICTDPVFSLPGGFYSGSCRLSFGTPANGETIYYTLDGSEPHPDHSLQYTPGTEIPIASTSIVRAQIFANGKIPGNIVTNTYFINERDFNLPVVSIVTEEKNLWDDWIGIYTVGKNGIRGVNTLIANYNRDWRRPANFELYDKTGTVCLNQELDISISGGGSRTNPQKSLKISPRKKFGDNRLRYDIFPAAKPNRKYKDIQFRNSGNDFNYSMMRDGFMHSLVINRMDIDYLAYEPAICFMNGEYYGIQNLRERSNKDYLYTNYGLDEEDFYLLETTEIQTHPAFLSFTVFLRDQDVTDPDIYKEISEMVDLESYMDYMIAEMYFENTTDWPHNNFKVWKEKEGGKWRWIMYDTDYGFNLVNLNAHNSRTVSYVFTKAPIWASYTIRRLILNETFKRRFTDRYCIHMSSTFATERVNHIMDSIASRIEQEIVHHKNKWGSRRDFSTDIANMKNFSATRAEVMLTHLSEYLADHAPVHTLSVTSNIPQAAYRFNAETIRDASIRLRYFRDHAFSISPLSLPGYRFSHWEIKNGTSGNIRTTNEETYTSLLNEDMELTAIYEEGDPLETPQVYINEIVASNTLIKDEYGDTDDYIELYNAGDTDINIAGWYLSDKPSDPTLYRIPETDLLKTLIPAKGRLIVWADSEPHQGVLHTNFGLSKSGETLSLAYEDAEGTVYLADRVSFPALAANMSYARVPDGSEHWVIQAPTFNRPNHTVHIPDSPQTGCKVYPTSVRDHITIKHAVDQPVMIYDLTGRIHLCTTSQRNPETIDLSHLPEGIYILKAGNKQFKIIKR
ncbi:MAG: CotH kinase family protein [Candidatus Azobacteroides sp.]|nr:CotH kinase family protein [Candidatus Azobacteroides sp.]